MKVWFITGASRGFGLEITKAVLASGDKVIAAVRTPDEFVLQVSNNENLLVVPLDVTNEEQSKKAVLTGHDYFGRIDVLVNNAGYGLLSAVEEASGEEVKKNYDTNVFGTLNVIRAVLPFMRKQRSGHIINISSVGGLTGSIGWGLYSSTKFAIEGITEALALELAPLGIKATVVEPGYFRTNFLDASSLNRTANIIEDYAETVGKMRAFATQVNRKQPGNPVKLAEAFIKLAVAENPPLHLPLGKDTLERYEHKTAGFAKDIENWYDVIIGTDHDDVVK
ncbi:oxidoreductase [uncultured Bacteroides sp.]|uniref:oxidoreductase n=1 Tax=uncultured Bacteroides sp. TaxID=162156 RepID=UPI002AA5EA63|nr:oxidoreductase [uncultured Bacteroides sp.]